MSKQEIMAAACQGKEQHKRETARMIAKRYGGKIVAYKCRFCKSWHVGRSN